jgi:hypothetical protein
MPDKFFFKEFLRLVIVACRSGAAATKTLSKAFFS